MGLKLDFLYHLFDKNTFNLSVGVLQGDILAPYLLVIVMDFVLRTAMIDDCGILMKKKSGTARRGSPAVHITDLDFADEIVLLGSTIPKAQKLVTSLEKAALKVGLRINQSKTEYILVGDWGDRKQRDMKEREGL